MALWQYSFQILTKESFDSLNKKDILLIDDDLGFDETPFWLYKSINRSFFAELESILPKNKSWSDEIDLYGNLESNCIEIFFEKQKGTVLSASVRIDFTSNYEDVLSQVIEFCIFKGLVMLDENLQITSLNLETIKNKIENAPQVRTYNELKND